MDVPTLEYEYSLLSQAHLLIAGVDEVGRGSWAGPIVAAAVVLPLESDTVASALAGVRDSKTLTARQREELAPIVRSHCRALGIGHASHHMIDRIGVAAANRRAMLGAVRNLGLVPDALLLDHFQLPETSLPQVAVTGGDAQCLSIAAASIVAKVVRDRWMGHADRRFPEYGFARHKGYGTSAHAAALRELGPCLLHRRSFDPVARCLR